jgi:glycosyltransferase involved in cell wall biosynthesis
MIRVLQVVGKMCYGGAETRLLQLARFTDSSRVYFDFCVFQDGPGDYDNEIHQMGFGIARCKLTTNILGFYVNFAKLIREGRYNIVHCHVHHFSGLPLRIAAKENVPKRIMHLRTVNNTYRNSLYRICYRKLMTTWIQQYATKIVSVSQTAMQAQMGHRWQEDPRAEVIYNGIDTKPFMISPDRVKTLAEFGIAPSAKVIIHVGNFGPAKDHETLIRTMSTIVARIKNVHLLLVGDGPLLPKIRRLVVAKGIRDYVHFAGCRRNVPQLLMASDCFLFPSRWEGLPGAVLEALAAGLPVIASDIGPVREIATESDRVHCISVGDANAFAQKTIEIISRIDSYKTNPGQIPEKFRLDMYVRKMLALYEDNH